MHYILPGVNTVGKSSSNDIVLLSELVSKKHAMIVYDHRAGRIYVTDNGSANESMIISETVSTQPNFII